MRGYISACAVLATMAVGAQGCKRADRENVGGRPDTTAAAVPAPAPAPTPLAVQGVDLGKSVGPDKRVTNPATTFGVRDTIYAAVSTTGTSSSANLTGLWTFGDKNRLVDSTSVPISPTGPAVTEFHVMRTSPWPVGKYKFRVMLNGQQVEEKEFEIKR